MEQRITTMIDNSKRIEELENKMNSFESTLLEIKNALVQQRKRETVQVIPPYSRLDALSRVEREKVESIMDQFDFEKVQSVMEDLDWKWAGTKFGVPTVEEMKREAERLLIDAVQEETTCSTGGFRAVYESEGAADPDPYIGLEFILEEREGFKREDDDDFSCGEDHDEDEDDE